MSIAAVALFAAATPALALPAAGTMFPADFAATDSAGTSRTLQSVAGRNGTVLVITRSARWCPYCQAQMKELEAARAPLAAKGYGLAAMTYDPPAVLAAFGAKNGLGYTLLADEGSANIDRLGLRDPAYPAGHFAHGVARASVLVVDAAGKISAVRIEDDYKVRPTVAQVVAMAK
jgi:peroxiredoxin